MTERRNNAADGQLQAAFDAQASSLNLPSEPAPCDAEARTIGVAFAVFKKTVDLQAAPAASPGAPGTLSVSAADGTDDASIAQTLRGYESLSPEDFAKGWRNHASDPHMGVGTSWVGIVDQEAVDHWLSSDALAKARAAYPPFSPRRVHLHDLHVTYIGQSRAAATYRVEEEHTNGQKSAGNAAAILMNVAGQGWRIVVVTKGGRGEI